MPFLFLRHSNMICNRNRIEKYTSLNGVFNRTRRIDSIFCTIPNGVLKYCRKRKSFEWAYTTCLYVPSNYMNRNKRVPPGSDSNIFHSVTDSLNLVTECAATADFFDGWVVIDAVVQPSTPAANSIKWCHDLHKVATWITYHWMASIQSTFTIR